MLGKLYCEALTVPGEALLYFVLNLHVGKARPGANYSKKIKKEKPYGEMGLGESMNSSKS